MSHHSATANEYRPASSSGARQIATISNKAAVAASSSVLSNPPLNNGPTKSLWDDDAPDLETASAQASYDRRMKQRQQDLENLAVLDG
jgi:hypothetical protein